MAVLGSKGIVRLKREAPDGFSVVASQIDFAASTVPAPGPGIWSGDRVTISTWQGLPLDLNNDGYADCPEGHGFWAAEDAQWILAPTREHVANDVDDFWQPSDSEPFWTWWPDVSDSEVEPEIPVAIAAYVYRDEFDNLSFYTTQAGAMSALADHKINFLAVNPGTLSIEPDNSDTGWLVQCDLIQWTLNLTAAEVDTTAVGETFGDAVKSIITGGGSFDFEVERKLSDGEQDSTALMRLLLMTEKGCKASAQFWMIEDRRTSNGGLLPGDLYYEADVLATQNAINTRATAVIAGSLNFVTTGEIKLRALAPAPAGIEIVTASGDQLATHDNIILAAQ